MKRKQLIISAITLCIESIVFCLIFYALYNLGALSIRHSLFARADSTYLFLDLHHTQYSPAHFHTT